MSKLKKITFGLTCVAAVVAPVVAISIVTHQTNKQNSFNYNASLTNAYNLNDETLNTKNITKFGTHNNVVVPPMDGHVDWGIKSEQHSNQHMDLWPTKLYVAKGTKFEVEAKGNSLGEVRIYIDGTFKNFQLTKRANQGHRIKAGEKITIEARGDGIIYLRNLSDTQPLDVDIYKENLQEYPVFTEFESTDAEFLEELKTTKAPFAQISNGFTNFTWETQRFLDMYEKQNDPKLFSKVSKRFADVAKLYGENIGLSTSSTGVAKKFAQKLQLETSKDHGFGYAGFQVAVTPMHWPNEFFTDTYYKTWGVLHEIGHLWQMQNSKLDGWGESSNNMLITMYQKRVTNNEYNHFTSDRTIRFRNRVQEAFEKEEIPYKSQTIHGSESMLMMEQLDTAFDGQFYPVFNQYYRTHYENGTIASDKRLDHLVVNASRVTNRDLSPFFDKWGLKFSEASRKIMNTFPKLQKEIWKNYLYGHTIKNNVKEIDLPKYEPVNIQDWMLPKNVQADYEETVSDVIEREKPGLQKLIPDGYVIESVVDKDKKIEGSVKISFNAYDPNNRYATENRFFLDVDSYKPKPLTTIGIGEYWGYGKKSRMKMQYVPLKQKIYIEGWLEALVLKSSDSKLNLKFFDPNGKLEREIPIDNTKTLQEIIDQYKLNNGIDFKPGSTIQVHKTNFGRYVILHTEPNHGHFYFDETVTLKLEGDVFVKQ